jgi:glycine/D-amino acid oxidase-like deaminating enzyme
MPSNDSPWPDSLWKATAEPLATVDGLPGDMETDLLIVGAGYTGLSCALHSSDSIDDIVVIDQMQPGWGCSGRNGGQVNPQWKPSLARVRQLFAGEDFNRFVDILDQSADLVFELIDRYRIECHSLRSGCVLATKGKKGRQYLAEWSSFWTDYGADVDLLDADATRSLTGSKAYDTCLLDRRGGSLQPLSYARGLARACLEQGVSLFGDTRALQVSPQDDGWVVSTSHGRISCRRLVIGTNGYTDGLWPGLAQSIIPVASMITASRPLPADIAAGILPGRHCVAEFAGVPAYFRIDESNRMVFGWRGTLTGGIGGLDTRHLRANARSIFPQLDGIDWEYDWAGYVGITSHQRPMLVRLGANAYAGLGYNGRGITMATMMGRQLSLQLEGRQTGVAVENLQRVAAHSLYPVGVTARIVSGHVSDFLRR